MEPITEVMSRTIRMPYVLRRVPEKIFASLLPLPNRSPCPGDIALARLEKIGRNRRLELADGRACTLHEGDLIAVVFGNRYATDQFEGYARADGEKCDLLSMGGVCGLVVSKHAGIVGPSKLRLLGALADAEGRSLRLRDFTLVPTFSPKQPQVVVVCGTAMNTGKTHAAMSLIVGLRRQEYKVASIKLTGTAAGRDTWNMVDAGATPALDFIDGGFPSTYLCSLDELLDLYKLLISHAASREADWIVVEIADGLFQKETASLLQSHHFTETVNSWVLAAGEPLAAAGGAYTLREHEIEPIALSGRLSMSPLGMLEAEAATGLRCLGAEELQRGDLNERLIKNWRGSAYSALPNNRGRAAERTL